MHEASLAQGWAKKEKNAEVQQNIGVPTDFLLTLQNPN